MIMSVSTFCKSSGAATPLSVVKSGMPPAPSPPLPLAASGAAGSVTGSRNAFESEGASAIAAIESASSSFRTSVSVPLTAAAAAMAGETRCVRPPLPWRPSKLRLLVEAQRSCGSSLSGFIAKHMEQPGSRQSKPASVRIASSPSASACSLTSPEPGTTMAYTWSATLRPLATAAACRTSSMRALVHDPMKTLSTLTPSSFSPAPRPMYSSARSMAAARSGVGASAGSGTSPVIGATSCGDVPHVRVGAMSAPSNSTSISYFAPSSLASVRQ
mmetsp:Transcript_12172/g.37545  ORF Transcript_12172/g.37545 Transcript_12172/m.37545 type:complete len:272 (+) Transcript_12172:656-1471(+)